MEKKCKKLMIEKIKKIQVLKVRRNNESGHHVNKWGKPLKIMSKKAEHELNNKMIINILKQLFPEDYKEKK